MGIDEMIEELQGFVTNEEFLNRVRDLLTKIKDKLNNIIGN